MIVIYSFLLGKTGISQSGYEDLIIIVTDLLVVVQLDVISCDSIFDYKS